MKVSDPQPPANDPSVNTDELDSSETVDSSQDDQGDEPSPFSQLLAKRRGASQEDAQAKSSKRNDRDLDPTGAGMMLPQTTFDQPIRTGQVESKHVAPVPPELQQLVREISVVVNAAGKQQVHIELNSNVLKGLHIQIERKDGAIAVQFQSTSDEVAKLLATNVDALSQGLADRGLTVADIRITRPQESAGARDYKSRSGAGSGQGRGQGGGRR